MKAVSTIHPARTLRLNPLECRTGQRTARQGEWSFGAGQGHHNLLADGLLPDN